MDELDYKNESWFQYDHTRTSLVSIKIGKGSIRGIEGSKLEPFQINFHYPIVAIAGRNGTGKTTVLALAACAYHNNDPGFKLFGRRKTYYTFSDFFIQSNEEVPPEGIDILYQYRHNRWKKTKDHPSGQGDGWLKQSKKKGGKWDNYNRRINRNVVYLGIERVLPDSEKDTAKNYSKIFSESEATGWEDEVSRIVGRILNRPYEGFRYAYTDNRKYRIPIVKSGGLTYSGFNMGAGESALFDIFASIYDSTRVSRKDQSALILVDEIELGLHQEAQTRLMYELKNLCAAMKVQVICTTHSPTILEQLPPNARVFLERFGDITKVLYGISSIYATGKLAGKALAELDVFVEDDLARVLLESALPNEVRSRINILPVGSAGAVIQQLAARYREIKAQMSLQACVVLDGDQARSESENLNYFNRQLESHSQEAKVITSQWARKRIDYLPGSKWPENWILSQEGSIFLDLCDEFGVSRQELNQYIDEARLAGKHDEFWVLSKKLNRDMLYIRARFCQVAMKASGEETERLCSFISQFLN